jgi:hypothetical protein
MDVNHDLINNRNSADQYDQCNRKEVSCGETDFPVVEGMAPSE